jgi:uncharacterized membrane protein YraQ (UPF0718 family)
VRMLSSNRTRFTADTQIPTAYPSEGGSMPTAQTSRRRYRPKVAAVVIPSPAAAAQGSPSISGAASTPAWVVLASALFAALVLGLLLVTALSAGANLAVVSSGFTIRFLSLFIEAAPFLLLGSIASGLIDAFVSPDHIARLMPRNRFLGVLMGTFAGFVFPVCECGVVPVVRQLYAKKLPASVGLAFLLAAPVMNPIVLLSTWTAFGFGPVLVGRYAITAVVAILTGLVFAFRGRGLELRQPRLDPSSAPKEPWPQTTNNGSEDFTALESGRRSPAITKIGSGLQSAVGEFFDMGRFLVIGSLLAAGMQTLVSQDVLASLGQGPFASVVTMQAVAFVLSVCSTVDAFLALAFTGTFTTGSILAFLTFGPMVDIKTTTMFLGVFKRNTVAWLTVLPFALTAIAGIALNLLNVR